MDATIDAGTCDDNTKTIKLHQKYHNGVFIPRPFEKWPDKFEIKYNEASDELFIRRSDVTHGGWGEILIIDVEYDYAKDNSNTNIIRNKRLIPAVIYQTFQTNLVPKGMYKAVNSWIHMNPDYEHFFYDNLKSIEFLQKHFGKREVEAYKTLLPGAFKADFWRLCILYKLGGIYVDADMICLSSLNNLIQPEDTFICGRDDPMSKSFLYNGFIASIPGHPFLKAAINRCLYNIENHIMCYELDITGPGCLGKAVNILLNRKPDTEFILGEQVLMGYKTHLLLHCWKRKGIFKGETQILVTEYPGKNAEMISIKSPTFHELVLSERVYRKIPWNIYYTAENQNGRLFYMEKSFKSCEGYNMYFYDNNQCLNFIRNEAINLSTDLGIDLIKVYEGLRTDVERADFWRYCIIYCYGGIYTDADTFCKMSPDKWINDEEAIFGIEACLDLSYAKSFGMDKIGTLVGDKIISICNWTFAAAKKHPILASVILGIAKEPTDNILTNTGPGRLTKHVLEFFSKNGVNCRSIDQADIYYNKVRLLSINRFGSNQNHSNAYKENIPFKNWNNPNIYIIHAFQGSWKYGLNLKYTIHDFGIKRKSMNLSIAHMPNKASNKYIMGISRLESTIARPTFPSKIANCREILFTLFNDYKIVNTHVMQISNYVNEAQFEDGRIFQYKNRSFFNINYLDPGYNSRICVLDDTFKFLGNVELDSELNYIHWLKPMIWEKNWLFFSKNDELYFVYSTMPNFIVYKCADFTKLKFQEHINISWPNDLGNPIPEIEFYFTKNSTQTSRGVSVGGSTNPIHIIFRKISYYMYFIHTKVQTNGATRYNNYLVLLDYNTLKPVKISYYPPISEFCGDLLFIMSMVYDSDNDLIILSGGINDNSCFTWKYSNLSYFENILFN
jgi:mannosyltransferase OCH1-like enzyme